MNILIFKTVNEERTKQLLDCVDVMKHEVYVVMPESKISIYKRLGLNIHCIGTEKEYIDYSAVMEEGRIPDIKFHEVWVPSPDFKNIYTYPEVYAVISELRYNKVYYKEIKKNEIVTYDLKKEKFFSHRYDCVVGIMKICIDFLYWMEKKVKRDKWECHVWNCWNHKEEQ